MTEEGKETHRSFRSLEELCKLGNKPFRPLRGTAMELDAIQEIIPEEELITYVQAEATKENFLKVTNTKILHCATHGFFLNCPDTENPLLKVGIAFSGANIIKEDGSINKVSVSVYCSHSSCSASHCIVYN